MMVVFLAMVLMFFDGGDDVVFDGDDVFVGGGDDGEEIMKAKSVSRCRRNFLLF